MVIRRLLKKLFGEGVIQRLRVLSSPQARELTIPKSINEQLMRWEKELEKERTKRLLENGQLDPRMLMPTIIFQSGKVGSTSVHESLIKKYDDYDLAIPVFHAHVLENIDQRIKWVRTTRTNPDNTISKLLESKELRKHIDLHPEWSWNVISLVRDPVALRVSAFFQLLDEYMPNWKQQFETGKLTLTELQRIFNEKGGIKVDGLNRWFDNQVKPIWGIDIYSSPFSKEKGYQIYRQNPKVNLMIIRLEDLDTVAKDAFYDFLGFRDFTIIKTNVGDKKAYNNLYKQFKTLPLPLDAVNEAYNSRYARHFYTGQEIDAFRNRWRLDNSKIAT